MKFFLIAIFLAVCCATVKSTYELWISFLDRFQTAVSHQIIFAATSQHRNHTRTIKFDIEYTRRLRRVFDIIKVMSIKYMKYVSVWAANVTCAQYRIWCHIWCHISPTWFPRSQSDVKLLRKIETIHEESVNFAGSIPIHWREFRQISWPINYRPIKETLPTLASV